MRGGGRPMLVGTINVIYGIGGIANANFFANDKRYVLDNVNTLGWVLVLLGVIQVTGALSLFSGNTYGRIIGVFAGTLGAIGALLSMGGNNPLWSFGVFLL